MGAFGNKFRNISTATTTTVKSGKGRLFKIQVNTAILSGVITIYDNTGASGTVIATVTNPATLLANQFQLDYAGLEFNTGLTIVTTLVQNITVIYE